MGISCKANSSGQLVTTASDFMKSSTSSCAAELQCPASKTKSSVQKKKLELFKYKDLEAATGGFAEANRIGTSSCHGELYKGRLSDGRVVTVKRPSTSSTLELSAAGRRRSTLWQQDEDAFENEVDILTKVFSRRLVNLLGYSQDAGKVKLLVVEFMENSSLHSQLRGAAGTAVNTAEDDVSSSSSSSSRSSCTTLSWPLRVHLALQTAKALRALHSSSPPIVHRDIRAMNVFIDRNWNARLGEFGLARHPVQDRRSCAAAATPARKSNLSSIPETSEPETEAAAAPALINPETDVLSFGVLLLEMISGKNAMSLNADCSLYTLVEWALPLIKQGNVLAICDPRIKLPLCATALKHMAAIAVRCLRPSAGSRQPTMTEVVEVLTKVSKLIPLPLWNGQTTRVINKSSPSSSSSPSCTHQQLDQQAAQPTSSCFLMSLDSHAMNCRIGRLIRLPMWLGFLQTNKKSKKRKMTKTLSKQQQQLPTTSCKTATKQSFVMGLGKSISSTFSKKLVLMSKTANQAKQAAARGVKRAKVSDDQLQQRPTSSQQRLPAATTATNPVAAAIPPPPLGRVSAPADSDSVSNRKPLESNTNSRSLTIARHHHRQRQHSQLSSTRKQQLH
jgi:serine/threonine protein kinase